jgi:hypothetical protein
MKNQHWVFHERSYHQAHGASPKLHLRLHHSFIAYCARFAFFSGAAGVPGKGGIMNLKVSMTLGVVALAISTVPAALGQCGMPTKGVKPAAWHAQFDAQRMVRIAEDESFRRGDGKSMVGMWHLIFTATTSDGTTIPATVIDNALVVWHSDHTEIMNSVRPAQDGNFCLGVWDQLDRSHYYLSHFPWYANEFPNDNASGIGDPQGPSQFKEWVTLGPDGDYFTGTFQLKSYDLSNNVLAAFTGTLAGTRITTSTTEQDLVGK